MELDLRIGAAFTRLQTLQLQSYTAHISDQPISYGIQPVQPCLVSRISNKTPGSCQFPTLGFVVDRYLRVRNFKPEKFWSIKVMHARDDAKVNFLWRRVHLFDRAAVTVMLERCLTAQKAKVVKVNQKPTSKWKPLPLTTVDLQMMGSRYLRMDSQRVMKVVQFIYECGTLVLTSSGCRNSLYKRVYQLSTNRNGPV